MLESIGNLPETIIRYFASQILLALDDIHQMTHTVYGALSPSQILIDKEGNIKVVKLYRNNHKIFSFHWDFLIKFKALILGILVQ